MTIAPKLAKQFKIATTCLFVCLSIAGVVHAADEDINSAIEDRRANLKGISKQNKLLSGMAKGEVDYDAGKATAAATKISEHAASLKAAALWPDGSDRKSTQHDGTRAKAVIWEDVDNFLTGFEELEAASANVAAEAGNGVDAFMGAIGAVGKTCKGCHQEYRGPKS